MRKVIKNILLVFAIAIFSTGCDLGDVVVDIIVPGYGGGAVIDVIDVNVYPDYNDDYYYDDGYDDYYYDDGYDDYRDDGFFFDSYVDF